MAFVCVAIKKDSVSLFSFPIFSYDKLISSAISLVYRLKYLYLFFLPIFVFYIFIAVFSCLS